MGSVPSHSLPVPNGTGRHGGCPSPTGLQTLQETRSEAKVFSHNDIWILRLRKNGVGAGAGDAASGRL